MTETQAPYLPSDEPTEATVCRLMLREIQTLIDDQEIIGNFHVTRQLRAKADALRAAMKPHRDDWTDEPQDEEQHIWSAG